mmetsp:Transcript_23339/g.71793  ORF Transcript_23339/g.71793 Transcript_23339/m.71793 type:complete len:334 (-) Transcript_23339:774-1775(-)
MARDARRSLPRLSARGLAHSVGEPRLAPQVRDGHHALARPLRVSGAAHPDASSQPETFRCVVEEEVWGPRRRRRRRRRRQGKILLLDGGSERAVVRGPGPVSFGGGGEPRPRAERAVGDTRGVAAHAVDAASVGAVLDSQRGSDSTALRGCRGQPRLRSRTFRLRRGPGCPRRQRGNALRRRRDVRNLRRSGLGGAHAALPRLTETAGRRVLQAGHAPAHGRAARLPEFGGLTGGPGLRAGSPRRRRRHAAGRRRQARQRQGSERFARRRRQAECQGPQSQERRRRRRSPNAQRRRRRGAPVSRGEAQEGVVFFGIVAFVETRRQEEEEENRR